MDHDIVPRWVPKWLRRSLWIGSTVITGLVGMVAGNGLFEAVKDGCDISGVIRGGWVWLILGLVSIGWPIFVSERSRTIFARRHCRDSIRKLLAALSEVFPKPNRTNIMLVTSDGNSRQVDKQTAYNMDHDPDNDLVIGIHAGVSGRAASERVWVAGDLSIAPQAGAASWNLLPEQQSRVKQGLQTIGSAPITDPRHVDGPILGTLQVDSTIRYGEFLGEDAESLGKVVLSIADVIALILAEGDYGIEKQG